MSEALIGLISGVIGAVLGALGTFFTLKYNYKHLYADVVSKSRDNWLNEMRKYVTCMLSAKMREIENKPNDNSVGYREARNQVILRLNEAEMLHVQLKEEIKRLDNCKSKREFAIIEENILLICRVLLKTEWDRVRKEAKGEN